MLTDFAILILAALCGNWLFSRCGLPGLLGMVAAGIILGPGSLDLMDDDVLKVLKEFKTVALIVILIRAGLGINKETLNRIGGPAIAGRRTLLSILLTTTHWLAASTRLSRLLLLLRC